MLKFFIFFTYWSNSSTLFPGLDVVSAINSSKKDIKILSGRYGLGGKDFTPSCVNAVYKNMQLITSKDDFTVGIDDDMFNSSLPLTKSPYSDNCFAIKILCLNMKAIKMTFT